METEILQKIVTFSKLFLKPSDMITELSWTELNWNGRPRPVISDFAGKMHFKHVIFDHIWSRRDPDLWPYDLKALS